MDLSNNSIITELDLLYLSNHVDYEKIKSENIKRDNEDYKFYRERLIHQTMKLIKMKK